MNTALLLIDLQNDYFPGGALPLHGSEEAGKAAGQLLAAFRAARLPVMHIQHIAQKPEATFFRPGTSGAEIHPCVAPQLGSNVDTEAGETVLVKHFPSAFRETPLLELLTQRRITHLVVAGMMTHMCVDTTVRAACDLGFACTLAHDACATRELSFNGQSVAAEQVQLAYMAALQGLFAQVRSAQDICAGMGTV